MAEQKKKIVIIDDETSFLSIFETALKNAGFEVKGFFDPEEFLRQIFKEKPDLILLDISMPEIDGLEVFERLKKGFGRKLPKTVFLTNLGGALAGASVDEHFAKNIGASGYLKKFEDLEITVKRVKEIINEEQ